MMTVVLCALGLTTVALLRGNGCATLKAENAILKSHRDEYLQMMADDAHRQEKLLALVHTLQANAAAGSLQPPAARAPAVSSVAPAATARAGAAAPATAAAAPAVRVIPAQYVGAMGVLMICYNRPKYLAKSLASMRRAMPPWARTSVPVVISQDGFDASVARVAREFVSANDAPGAKHVHIQHTQSTSRGDTAYHKLCQHYKWALTQAFADSDVQRVVIVEDDMDFAADFFDYFKAMASLLDADRTLMAASAFNDNGMAPFVADSAQLYRSDFFPGLGWMMTRTLWEELEPKWPKGWWDDWLREPSQRKGRAFIRPEVSRIYTFGEKGASNGEWWSTYLATQKLNDQPFAFDSMDLTSLTAARFDPVFDAAVAGATLLPGGAADLLSGGNGGALRGGGKGGAVLKIEYTSNSGRERTSYEGIAKTVGLIPNVKAGVPRTAYRGVVVFKHKGRTVYLVPKGGKAFYSNSAGF
jgi:alpha-1,3-mannosyl-glycoprotein beta-1,2-N-acetylglucosaminyltransferase